MKRPLITKQNSGAGEVSYYHLKLRSTYSMDIIKGVAVSTQFPQKYVNKFTIKRVYNETY